MCMCQGRCSCVKRELVRDVLDAMQAPDSTMTRFEAAEADLEHRRRALIEARDMVAKAEERLEKLRSQPVDDYPDGTYLILERVSDALVDLGLSKNRLFVKRDGRWHDQRGHFVPWQAVIGPLNEGYSLWVVTEMTQEG